MLKKSLLTKTLSLLWNKQSITQQIQYDYNYKKSHR